jgi:hypothetical protein
MDGAGPPSPASGRVNGVDRGACEPTSRGDDALAQGVWEQVAGPLSDASMRLRSLRNRCAGGSAEAYELDEAIASIDQAFGSVMRAPPPTAAQAPPPSRRSPSSAGATSYGTARSGHRRSGAGRDA